MTLRQHFTATGDQSSTSSPKPRILGLTGGIGAGKSFVGHLLVQAGFPLFDSDAVARSAYTESETVREQVTALLGSECYDAEGLPRYREIARRVFATSTAGDALLHQLEQIIHPYVSEQLVSWAREQQAPEGWLVLESAILWQSGFDQYCDAVAVVTAPEAVRIARVQQRDRATREQVKARMSRQQALDPTALRQAYPDKPIYTICNDGTQEPQLLIAELLRQLKQL